MIDITVDRFADRVFGLNSSTIGRFPHRVGAWVGGDSLFHRYNQHPELIPGTMNPGGGVDHTGPFFEDGVKTQPGHVND